MHQSIQSVVRSPSEPCGSSQSAPRKGPIEHLWIRIIIRLVPGHLGKSSPHELWDSSITIISIGYRISSCQSICRRRDAQPFFPFPSEARDVSREARPDVQVRRHRPVGARETRETPDLGSPETVSTRWGAAPAWPSRGRVITRPTLQEPRPRPTRRPFSMPT